MLRRQARLRREYLFRKSVETKHKKIEDRKAKVQRSIEEGIPIHGDLRYQAIELEQKLRWNDKGN